MVDMLKIDKLDRVRKKQSQLIKGVYLFICKIGRKNIIMISLS